MSHNVQISGIKINDLNALDKACAELRKEGVNVTLERGTGSRSVRFRTFMGARTNDPTADHVIRMPDASYDIGLIRQPAGHYEPVYDNALGISVRSPIACEYRPDNRFDYLYDRLSRPARNVERIRRDPVYFSHSQGRQKDDQQNNSRPQQNHCRA